MNSAPVRVLVVDDEALARATLRLLLQRDPEVELVGESPNGVDAVAKIRALAPDLVFLDIQMAKKTGFEVLAEIEEPRRPLLIFVTAYDAHALRAFEVQALDYLLKPFDDDRFARSLARGKDAVRQRHAHELARRLVAVFATAAAPSPAPERLAVKDGSRVRFIPVADLDWIEADDYYAKLHARGEIHLHRESLRDLEAQLDPRRFVRIHRSTIVNLERVKELRTLPSGEGLVLLQDGTELRLSRSRREQLCALLGLG